jgi:hypothetical protein
MSERGELLAGGDWAIAHGDADGLAHVAAALARITHEEVARDLRDLCKLCADDAAARWPALRYRCTTTESNSVPCASIA